MIASSNALPRADIPLIVGAGPVGLAAAVFLAKQGIAARLLEPRAEISTESRALAINPRTLEILDQAGIVDRVLAIGLKIRTATLWKGARPAAHLDISRLRCRYPFMLALSQAAT